MGRKGAYKLPTRKASQVLTGKGVSWKLAPSSPDRGGADSDEYSTVSEAPSSRQCRRRRQNEKCLTPTHLDMLIFKSTDPNMDMMYTLWRFDMQGWLDQYQEESMMPHIYTNLQGYLGRWVHSLEVVFTMAELPEREQVNMSFNTLHMLAKKMEAHQPSRSHRSRPGSSEAYRDKYRRYPVPTGRVATLEDEELFPPDPEIWDVEPPEIDQIEGLSVRMTQAMNHDQWEQCCCFVCGATDHFAWDCPHHETFRAWHKEHLISKGVSPQNKACTPTNLSQE